MFMGVKGWDVAALEAPVGAAFVGWLVIAVFSSQYTEQKV